MDVYKRPFDPRHPIICMDESPKQLISETRVPIPASPGRTAKHDYEYKRCGKSNIFLACEPLAGKRMVKVTERRTALEWACFVEEIAAQYEYAEKITLVMDNLNTHNAGSLYEKFPPDKAKALWDRFEFVQVACIVCCKIAVALYPDSIHSSKDKYLLPVIQSSLISIMIYTATLNSD